MRHNVLRRLTEVGTLFFCLLIFAQVLAAQSPAPTHERADQPAKLQLPEVHMDGHYFVRDGKRFIPVGAHWVPAKAAMQWPMEWDPKDIEADFAKMHQLGYTTLRLT